MPKDKKTIYLFFGEDNFSSTQKVNHWKEEFEKKYGDINVETLNGKQLGVNEFSVAIEAAPFLAEKRLVVVENLLSKGNIEEQRKIADKLEESLETSILVFLETDPPDQRTVLFKKIKKVGEVQEFHPLSMSELTTWILQKANEQHISISSAAATYLASMTGSNLWNIENELEKLRLYCKNREIKKEDVDILVQPTLTSSIFKLTDYLAQRNRRKSIEILNILKDSGEGLIPIFFMIVRHFRILLQVSDLMRKKYNKQQILGQMKENPYAIQIAIEQSRNFNTEELKIVYGKLHELDIGIKTGKIKSSGEEKKELSLVLEKFIVEFCEQQ